MSRLLLLRHARAVWAAPGRADRDRELADGGVADAARMGALMLAQGLVPGLALCSPARRAEQTLEAVARGVGPIRTLTVEALYGQGGQAYLDAIRRHADIETLLVVGHNPMVEDLTLALCAAGDAGALAAVGAGYPACGLAVIGFDGPLSSAAPRSGRLELFLSSE